MSRCAACGDTFEQDETSVAYAGKYYHDMCIWFPPPVIAPKTREQRERLKDVRVVLKLQQDTGCREKIRQLLRVDAETLEKVLERIRPGE